MVFDQSIFKEIIIKRKKNNNKIPITIKIAAKLFDFKIIIGILNIFEWIICKVITLQIPIYKDLVYLFINNLPSSPFLMGTFLRAIYYSKFLKHLGKNVIIEEGVKIINPEFIEIHENAIIERGVSLYAGIASKYNKREIKDYDPTKEGYLTIGNNVIISQYTTIGAHGGLKIGKNTGIGPKCSIFSYAHISMKPQVCLIRSMNIGENVAIGTNSSIICVKSIENNKAITPNSFLSEGIFNINKKRINQ